MFSEECDLFNKTVKYYKKGLFVNQAKFAEEIDQVFPDPGNIPLGYTYKPIEGTEQEVRGFTVHHKLNQMFKDNVFTGLQEFLAKYDTSTESFPQDISYVKCRNFQKFLPKKSDPNLDSETFEYYNNESSGSLNDMKLMYKEVVEKYRNDKLTPTLEEVNEYVNQNAYEYYEICHNIQESTLKVLPLNIIGKIFDYVNNSDGEGIMLS